MRGQGRRASARKRHQRDAGAANDQGLLTLYAQPIHEDVDQAPGARLPACAGIEMGEAGERAQHVGVIGVRANFASSSSALHHSRHRVGDPSARGCVELRRAADHRLEGRRDDFLGRDIVDEQPHPGMQRLARRQCLGEAIRRIGQLLDLPAIDRFDDRVASWKVPVESADPDAGPPRDLLQADVGSGASEGRLRRPKQPVAVTQRVGARLPHALRPLILGAPDVGAADFAPWRGRSPLLPLAKRREPPYSR